jgi:hypothetical protein
MTVRAILHIRLDTLFTRAALCGIAALALRALPAIAEEPERERQQPAPPAATPRAAAPRHHLPSREFPGSLELLERSILGEP